MFINLAQSPYQPALINRTDLVKNNLASLTMESQIDTGGVVSTFGGQRGDDHGSNVPIHLVRGYDEAGTSFPDLVPYGGVKVSQVYFEAGYYHFHSILSHLFSSTTSPLIIASSPYFDIDSKTWLHPALGLFVDFRIR